MSAPDIRRYFKHGTLPQLRLFEAIARLGTYARAAQELHMAQPTASLQIKKLTATVGVPLFEQVGKRVRLTEAGGRVHESCADLFRVFDELERSLSPSATNIPSREVAHEPAERRSLPPEADDAAAQQARTLAEAG